MKPLEQTLLDQLDQYIKGTLSGEDRLMLEAKMIANDEFRKQAEEHFNFIARLQQFNERNTIRQRLDQFHKDVANDSKIQATAALKQLPITGLRRYWPTLAVAASVAFISIIGTIITTESLKNKQTADYKELRGNVEQIKKSQRAIIADIKESKGKADPAPANYVGTGFLVSADGYVATSFHVIRDADSVYLENKKFGRVKAIVVKADAQRDVAILKIDTRMVDGLSALPYNFLLTESDLGENVYTLGFPREDIVYGEGTISAATGYKQNDQAYQIAVPVNPGNSGGPLLNKQGELVGMISGIQTETTGAAFAVKSSVLNEVITTISTDSLATPIQLSKQNRLKNLSRIQQIKKLQEYVFIVKVYNDK